MQYANIMVALGGDAGNTVPRYQVPASEIALLRAIHGPAAVHDIEPCDAPKDEDGKTVRFNNRDELRRLKEKYAGPNTTRIVEGLYPGAGAQVVQKLDDLDIPDELYKPKSRMRASDGEDPDQTDRERYGATRLPGRNEGGSASRAETDAAVDAGLADPKDTPKLEEKTGGRGKKPDDILG